MRARSRLSVASSVLSLPLTASFLVGGKEGVIPVDFFPTSRVQVRYRTYAATSTHKIIIAALPIINHT